MKKQIGILGSGVVAQTLGDGFIKHGYSVMLGTRDTSKLTEWKNKNGDKASVGSFADAAAYGSVVVLAVKGKVAPNALKLAGESNLSGKTVIDATNPIDESGMDNGVIRFFSTINHSLMENLQDEFPEAHFVKAFNSVGNAHMVDPGFESKPTMFICGNQPEAKAKVSDILKEFGWEAEDFGTAASARAIEPLCMLWCIPGLTTNQWNHAFKLLKK